jgi:hypothetical protein
MNPIATSTPDFETRYVTYKTEFDARQARSSEFYRTVAKVASVASVLGGIAGFVGFAAGSRAYYLSIPGDFIYHVALLTVMSVGIIPASWLVAGVLLPLAGACLGSKLIHLAGRIAAHVKEIDYFSPGMKDYVFAGQNEALKAQRDELEKLFHAKHYAQNNELAEKIESYLNEVTPLSVFLQNDPTYHRTIQSLQRMADFSETKFCHYLNGLSNTELQQHFYSYDKRFVRLNAGFEASKQYIALLLHRQVTGINVNANVLNHYLACH